MRSEKPENVLRRRFSSIVVQAVSAHDILKDTSKRAIEESRSNPVMKTDTNTVLTTNIQAMEEHGRYMRTKAFVMNNIEHLSCRALKKILGKNKPAKSIVPLARQTPAKATKMDQYDEAVILRILTRGGSIEKVLEHFPQYTRRQIFAVKRSFGKVRTEEYPVDMAEALLSIKRHRTHWF